jgi:hypothetical protein
MWWMSIQDARCNSLLASFWQDNGLLTHSTEVDSLLDLNSYQLSQLFCCSIRSEGWISSPVWDVMYTFKCCCGVFYVISLIHIAVDLHRGSLLLGFGCQLPLWTEYGCSKEDDFTLELVNSRHMHWPVPNILSAEYGGTQHIYNWLVLLLLWTLLTFHFIIRAPLSEREV